MSIRAQPPDGTPRARNRLRAAQWPIVLGLTALWMLLWGRPSAANALTGVVVGIVVCVIFPLPPIETRVRLRPLGVLRFAGRFAIDMVASTWRLMPYILGTRRPLSAVVSVRLRAPGDLTLTITSAAVAAVPGSNVLDVHRASGTVYLHVLGAGKEPERAKARYEVLRLEARVVRAFGTRADVAALRAEDARTPPRRTGGAAGGSDPRKEGGPWGPS